jgi:hypothetical protein
MAADFTFPADLIATARQFATAGAELRALYPDLPPSAESWTDEQRNRVAAVRDRELAAALALSRHGHWQTYEGGDRTVAKAALQQQTARELSEAGPVGGAA